MHDEGPPIDPALVGSIVEPLHRGREHHIDESGSLGLGLYIVRRIVRGHRGTVAVASDAATGTTSTVRLPRRAAGAGRT